MEKQRIVYLCPTLLHLMNCIVTQMTINKGIPADIVFEDVTDFSGIRERLMRHDVFEHCYEFPYLVGMEKYRALETKAQRNLVDHQPSRAFELPDFKEKYTDLCTNIDSFAPKFFYYGLLEKGMRPKVHFVSEGTGSYALDFANTRGDGMDHKYYKERSYMNNLGNLYVYRPDLYTGGSKKLNLVEIPAYSTLTQDIYDVVEDVFGKAEPINEKLIFFEGCFWGDNFLLDEVGILLDIAKQIGKENIIIKRHPRNTVDRFSPLGFKVMPNQTIPWEVMIKDIDLSQKILVSVASFTCYSAFEMYGRTSNGILLKDVMLGRVNFLENPGYRRFFQKAEKVFNEEQIASWSPKNREELAAVLTALEERVGGWKHE